MAARLPKVTKWHEARARGAEEVFRRVEDCGDDFAAVARCTSGACRKARRSNPDAGVQRIPLGCSSRLFCDDCKLRIAARFRREFNAARLGVLWAIQQQGRNSRWRPKHGPEARFSERLTTVTVPHVGTPEERVEWLYKTWPAFLKRWNEYVRAQLGGERCTSGKKRGDGQLSSIPVDRDGRPIELVAELCHSMRTFEWTEGDDAQGHPHFHIWNCGPYVPQSLLAEWWKEAWEAASGHETPVVMVDVRQVIADTVEPYDGEGPRAQVANELIKYLTKDWGAEPEVFARVFSELVDRRARQTSSGFASFSVALIRICEDCGCVHESKSGFQWTIESKHGEPLIRAEPRERGPPLDEPREKTDAEIVAELFEEAYRRRTASERARIGTTEWALRESRTDFLSRWSRETDPEARKMQAKNFFSRMS